MNKAYYIPNGPKNLSLLFPAIDFAEVAKYFVQVKDSEGDVVATSPINEIGGCCLDEYKVRIHFLNGLGGIDAINFKILEELHETRSDSIEKPVQYPLEKPLHGSGRFNIRGNDTYTLVTTDYAETDKDWLEELFDSPLAWMEWSGTQGQEDSYIPVIILDAEFPKVKKEDRFNYEVTLQVKLSHEKFIIRN